MNVRLLRLVLMALGCAMGVMSLCGAAGRGERVRVQGVDYVSLIRWTEQGGFTARWLKKDEILLATNRTARLKFSIDSREAWVNDVHIWLSFPLLRHGNDMLIAQRDVDLTVRPLLNPPKNRAGEKIRTICLDAGHGGRDPGNRVGGKQEKDYTLRLAVELGEQLVKAGYKVTFTRLTDTLIDLGNRPDIARRQKADLFISLHFNATENGRNEARGSETYALTPGGARSTAATGEGAGGGFFPGNRNDEKNMLLAYQIQKSLVRNLRTEDRGVRRARFAVLRDATMPAVLIEAGFMSHPAEGQKIFDANYRREMARSIVNGVQAYQRAVE